MYRKLANRLYPGLMLLCLSMPVASEFRCPVTPEPETELDYQQRTPVLCEGFVTRQRSQPPIELMGFISENSSKSTANTARLHIRPSWQVPSQVSISSVFDRPEELYRMDAVIAPQQELVWQWQETLGKTRLNLAEINFLAWVNSDTPVYVPVLVSKQTSEPILSDAIFSLRPAIDLAPLAYRILNQESVSPWQRINTVYAWEQVQIKVATGLSGTLEVKGRDADGHWIESSLFAFDTGAHHAR